MKVLVLEDDSTISALVCQGLQEAGLEGQPAYDGDQGLQFAKNHKYDLFIVDLMLPHRDGLSFIEQVRNSGVETPVLILSAKRSVDDRVQGLRSGGDDYLVKPFAMAELVARVQALLRRTQKQSGELRLIGAGIELDLLKREATREGKKIDLQEKEFALLEYFMRNPGTVLTKIQILDRVWNYNFDPQTNVVDVLVCRLRNKVDKEFSRRTIQTIRGVGYVFKEP